jgi:hypothetical protein
MGKLQVPGLTEAKEPGKLQEDKEWILDKPHY